MARNWRIYEGGPSQPERNAIYATLNVPGEIILNRHTFEVMKRPAAVILMFDPDTGTVGVKAASPLMPNAFPVKPKGGCDNRVIRAKPFCETHEIKFDCTVRFREALIENDVLVLDLRKTVRATRKKSDLNRKRR